MKAERRLVSEQQMEEVSRLFRDVVDRLASELVEGTEGGVVSSADSPEGGTGGGDGGGD